MDFKMLIQKLMDCYVKLNSDMDCTVLLCVLMYYWVLFCNQLFLEKIKVVNPSIIMVERIFGSFKPFFVKVMMECNTYCCIYHVKWMNLMSLSTTLGLL